MKFGLHEPTSTGQETKIGQQRLYFPGEHLRALRFRLPVSGNVWLSLFLSGNISSGHSMRTP